jgi:hypothetical protein
MISLNLAWNEFKESPLGTMLMASFATAAGAGVYHMVSTMSNDPVKALVGGVATTVGLAVTSAFIGQPSR